jgi:hypothetical protein
MLQAFARLATVSNKEVPLDRKTGRQAIHLTVELMVQKRSHHASTSSCSNIGRTHRSLINECVCVKQLNTASR